MKLDSTTIGNILFALAAAFLIDNIAMNGVVSKLLPGEIIGLVGFVIFGGVAVYAFKQAKKLN